MKIITKYQCEICGREFRLKKEALKCESKGKELPLAKVGEKVLFEDDWNGGFGTMSYETVIGEIDTSGHNVQYALGDQYSLEDGEQIFHPDQYVDGNEQFKKKCTLKR